MMANEVVISHRRHNNPTRIKSFCRQNQHNAPRRYLLPLLYISLVILYFYGLLIRDVGSGRDARQRWRTSSNMNDESSSSYLSEASSLMSPPVKLPYELGTEGAATMARLEPRSLADIAIANAEIAWRNQRDREEYYNKQAELKREKIKKRLEEKELREKQQEMEEVREQFTQNVTIDSNSDVSLFRRFSGNATIFHSSKPNTPDNLRKLVDKKLIHQRQRSDRKPYEQRWIIFFLFMMSISTVFRLYTLFTNNGSMNQNELSSEDETETDQESRFGRIGLSTFLSRGRGAVRLRRQARSRQTQQQFQSFVDRVNAQRRLNGEGQISAEALRLVVSSRDFTGNDYDRLWQFHEENGPALGSLFSSIGATEAEINRCPSRTLGAKDDLIRERRLSPQRSSSRFGSGERLLDRHTCSICLERYQLGDTVRTIPCFHTFHTGCIDPWLLDKAECPICKHPAIG